MNKDETFIKVDRIKLKKFTSSNEKAKFIQGSLQVIFGTT